ncbi:MAG: phenylacetate--CoA ligase family protein [Nitrospirae bacterium]|nr:phenylacetate--CoA ligase family protein [Nitrospirota bacterium]
MDFKLRYFRYPYAIYKKRALLEKSQWFDKQYHKDNQLLLLKKLLSHSYAHVPYYRNMFKALGLTPADVDVPEKLSLLPLLTKDDVRNNFKELIADNAALFDPVLSRSGGTTGTALEFYIDKVTNVMEFATVWRHWNWAGYRFGDRFCDLRGRIIRGDNPIQYDWRLNALFLSSYRMTRSVIGKYAQKLRAFKPTILRGYPSAIDIFARLLREQGINDIRPRAVITSSETLLAHQRANLQEVFGCTVYDTYGLEERSVAAGQCPHGNLHFDDEYGIMRVIDNGVDVDNGNEGELVCTGLHSYAMPLINYRTNDLGTISTEKCPCGRGLSVARSVTGRVEDMIITPDGRYVAGSGLSVAFKHSMGIRLSQIVQENIDEMTIKIVRAPTYTKHDETTLLANLRDRVGNVIRINMEFVNDIPLTKAGKLKFVVSGVKPDVR